MFTNLSKLLQLSVFSLVLLVSGCAQRETGAGISDISGVPEQDFEIISGRASASAVWVPELSNGRGLSLQVGNAGGFKAITAMQWDPAEVLPDSFEIDEVRIRLTTARIYPSDPDSSVFVPDLRMIVYEIQEEWDQDELTPGTFENYSEFPILDTIIVPAESDDSLFYDVPLELWQKWVDEKLGDTLDSDTLTSFTTYGLLLAPENEGVLVEFATSNARGLADTTRTAPLLQMIGTKYVEDPENEGVYLDSALFLEQYNEEDGYVTFPNAELQDGRHFVTQGYPQRALVYFPLDTLAAYSDRLVVHAEFRMYAEFDNPLTLNYDVGILYKTGSTTNNDWVSESDSLESVELLFVGTNTSTFDGQNDYVAFNVTGIVSGWVADIETIGTLQLQTSSENQFLTREVFYSATAEDSTKRPELVIWYAEPSN